MRAVRNMPALTKRMRKLPPEDIRGEGIKLRYVPLGVVLALCGLVSLDIWRSGDHKTAVMLLLPGAVLFALLLLWSILKDIKRLNRLRRSWASLSPAEKIRIEADAPGAESLHCLLFTRDAVVARMGEGVLAIPMRDIIWINPSPNGKKAQIVTRYEDRIDLRSPGFRKKWRIEDLRKAMEPFTTAVVYGNKSQRYSILAGEEFFSLIHEAEKKGSYREPRESKEERALAQAGYEIVGGRLAQKEDHAETPLEAQQRRETEDREQGKMPGLRRRMKKIHSYHPSWWSVVLLHLLSLVLAWYGKAGIRYLMDHRILTQPFVREELSRLFLLIPVLFFWLPMISARIRCAFSLGKFTPEEKRRIDRDASRAHEYYYLLFTRDAVLAKLYGGVLAIPLRDIVWVHTTDVKTLCFVTRKRHVYTFRHVGGGRARWLPEYIQAYTGSGRHGILFGRGEDGEYNSLWRWNFKKLVAMADAAAQPPAVPPPSAGMTAAEMPASATPSEESPAPADPAAESLTVTSPAAEMPASGKAGEEQAETTEAQKGTSDGREPAVSGEIPEDHQRGV